MTDAQRPLGDILGEIFAKRGALLASPRDPEWRLKYAELTDELAKECRKASQRMSGDGALAAGLLSDAYHYDARRMRPEHKHGVHIARND